MAVVRSAADSAKKFVTRAGAAAGDYASGVANAGSRWQAGAEASDEAYKSGVTEAMNEGRFTKGIRKAGAAKYQNNATKLGPDRFRTGVQNAEGAYSTGVQPFISAMQGFDYGPKGARGSSTNRARIDRHLDLMKKTRRETLGLS
jgi:hypothetical protein